MERYIKIAGGKMRVILCLLVWMLVGAACDSFLDIAPSKKTNIELSKVEHLDALLAAINTTTGNTSLVLSPDITEICVHGKRQLYRIFRHNGRWDFLQCIDNGRPDSGKSSV